jgi:iron complex transport system substrate-binding protein
MPSYRGRSPQLNRSTGSYLSLTLAFVACGLTVFALARPAAAQWPSVASINLCTDQLVLTLADPSQVRSVSWLSADPEESMLAAEAARHPLNYGSAEELIGIGADVIVAGSLTSPFTRELLRRLGATIVEVAPANSLDEVRRNLRQVGAAIGRGDAAADAIREIDARVAAIAAARDGEAAHSAIVVRPGGFTIGRNTLAFELLELAGLENGIAELDRWGSLSIETLLAIRPEYIVITDYRSDEPSLANAIFRHPALASLASSPRALEVPARYFACGAPASLRSAEVLQRQMATR